MRYETFIDVYEGRDFYDLDAGDDYEQLRFFCADCGEPGELCECSAPSEDGDEA